jgi:hypothetical protein
MAVASTRSRISVAIRATLALIFSAPSLTVSLGASTRSLADECRPQSGDIERVAQVVRNDGQELVAHHRGTFGAVPRRDRFLVKLRAVERQCALVRERGQEGAFLAVELALLRECQEEHAQSFAT